MDEIFRQLPSREIPDMARLACGMEGRRVKDTDGTRRGWPTIQRLSLALSKEQCVRGLPS